MVDVKFEAVPDFNKELKKLSKRYKLLNEDFENFRTVLAKKIAQSHIWDFRNI